MNSKAMKVKYLMLSALGALALTASAQQTTKPANSMPAFKTAFERSGGHWFLTIQGGLSAQLLGENEKMDFGKRLLHAAKASDNTQTEASYLRIMPTLSVGKWHNPYFATRVQLFGGLTPLYNTEGGVNVHTYNTATIGAHYDFMFDVVNYFAKYNPKRFFHVIPWVGLGYNFKYHDVFGFKEPYRHSVTGNAGMEFAFRLGKRVDLVLEAQVVYNNLNLIKQEVDYDVVTTPYVPADTYAGLMTMFTAGLNFNLGKVEWETVEPMDYQLINDLNSQISRLRSENAELSKRPAFCPECPEVEEVEDVVVDQYVLTDKAILFDFDKSNIRKDQQAQLGMIAEFVKKYNTPIVVVGYADPTGKSKYNMELSKRRAQAVVNELTNRHGVPADLITMEWEGATNKFTPPTAWNRVVIVRTK